jgi:hypothetical protein
MEQRLPEPPTEMTQLDWFLGRWDVVSKSKNQKGDWLEEAMGSEHSTILGGHVILEHFWGQMMGKPFEAWSLRKFNPAEDRWEQRWVDTTPGGFADWTGHWDEEAREFTGNPNRVLTPEGTLMPEAVRELFFDIENDRFSWKYETSEDGGRTWTLSWSLAYQRTDG